MAKLNINSVRMPVYRDSGFDLTDAASAADAFEAESTHQHEPDKYIYSRYRNPTVVSAEEEIAKLEGSNWALLTQSGMSAIDIALSLFQKGKDTRPWLFFNEIYGGTISFVENILKGRRGIEAHYFSPGDGRYDLDEFERKIELLKPDVVYAETVSNPMVMVADITKIADISARHGASLIVDNTFATPWLYKPLDSGASLVIHSATKYFSGHGNLTAGVICGNAHFLMQKAIEYRKFVGHQISPDDAYRLQTQIGTFHLRFPRQCENASRLASFLGSSEQVGKVFFPGLPDHPTHKLAKELFDNRGYGAMITFDLYGKDKEEKKKKRDKFISLVSDNIRLIPTLGDPHTILLPVESVWGIKYPEPGMIRLSVGFEDYAELADTISKALKSL